MIKRRLALLIAGVLAVSCGGKSNEETVTYKTETPEPTVAIEAPPVEPQEAYENPEAENKFKVFVENFSRDSAYQVSHVKFPLKHTFVRDPLQSRSIQSEESAVLISKANYTVWNLVNPAPEAYGDAVDINVSIVKDNNAVVEVIGREGRVHIEFYFYKTGSDWVLGEIVDYSI